MIDLMDIHSRSIVQDSDKYLALLLMQDPTMIRSEPLLTSILVLFVSSGTGNLVMRQMPRQVILIRS